MKKVNMKFIAVDSILSLGGFALYKYSKTKQIEKNTEEYILNEEKEPERKYTSLFTVAKEETPNGKRIKLTKKRK